MAHKLDKIPISGYQMGSELWTITERKLVDKIEYKQHVDITPDGWYDVRIEKIVVGQEWEENKSNPFVF